MSTAVATPVRPTLGGKLPRNMVPPSALSSPSAKKAGIAAAGASPANGNASIAEKKPARVQTDQDAIDQPLRRKGRNFFKLGVFFSLLDSEVATSTRWINTLGEDVAPDVHMSWTKTARNSIGDMVFGLAVTVAEWAAYYADHAGVATVDARRIKAALEHVIADPELRENAITDITNIGIIAKRLRSAKAAAPVPAAVPADGKKPKHVQKSATYGLKLPIGRFRKVLASVCSDLQISEIAPAMLTRVLESLLVEVIFACRTVAFAAGCRQVTPTHVKLALADVQQDVRGSKVGDPPLGDLLLGRSRVMVPNTVLFLRANTISLFKELDVAPRRRAAAAGEEEGNGGAGDEEDGDDNGVGDEDEEPAQPEEEEEEQPIVAKVKKPKSPKAKANGDAAAPAPPKKQKKQKAEQQPIDDAAAATVEEPVAPANKKKRKSKAAAAAIAAPGMVIATDDQVVAAESAMAPPAPKRKQPAQPAPSDEDDGIE